MLKTIWNALSTTTRYCLFIAFQQQEVFYDFNKTQCVIQCSLGAPISSEWLGPGASSLAMSPGTEMERILRHWDGKGETGRRWGRAGCIEAEKEKCHGNTTLPSLNCQRGSNNHTGQSHRHLVSHPRLGCRELSIKGLRNYMSRQVVFQNM